MSPAYGIAALIVGMAIFPLMWAREERLAGCHKEALKALAGAMVIIGLGLTVCLLTYCC